VVDASCTVSPGFADCMAALITVWSFEPVGLKEVPGPTLIIEPKQFAEKKHTNQIAGGHLNLNRLSDNYLE